MPVRRRYLATPSREPHVNLSKDNATLPNFSEEEIAKRASEIMKDGNSAYEIVFSSSSKQVALDHIGDDIVLSSYSGCRKYWEQVRDKDVLVAAKVLLVLDEAFETIKSSEGRTSYNQCLARGMSSASPNASGKSGIIDVLRSGTYGLVRSAVGKVSQFDMKIPEIVVIGDENTGKSSTLERIAMREAFPRDENFCTRMRVVLELKNRSYENVVSLQHNKYTAGTNEKECMDSHTCGCTEDITSFGSDLGGNRISNAMQDVLARAFGTENTADVLDDHEIVVEVRAPDVPDLRLIDLPGIVAVPPEIHAKTKGLVQEYFKGDRKKNTLFICVVSSKLDSIRSAPILGLIEEAQVWNQCICVLTKADVTGVENIKKLVSRVTKAAPDTASIKCPIVAVCNRDTTKQSISLAEANAQEDQFFRQSMPDLVAQGQVGLDGVLRAVDKILAKFIAEQWVPNERTKIEGILNATRDELKSLGLPPGPCLTGQVLKQVKQHFGELMKTNVGSLWSETFSIHEELHGILVGNNGLTFNAKLYRFRQRVDALLTDQNLFDVWRTTAINHVLSILNSKDLPLRLCRFEYLRQTCQNVLRSKMLDTEQHLRNLLVKVFDHAISTIILIESSATSIRKGVLSNCIHHVWVQPFLHNSDWLDQVFQDSSQQSVSHLLRESSELERVRLLKRIEECEHAIKVLNSVAGNCNLPAQKID